jgi:hypothetical protein
VAIASMAASMASAGVKTWDAPAPTMTMALGGSNRDQEDFSQCVERGIDAAPPAPWGNGLPPKVIITTGPKGRDPRICQQGAGLLTSALYSWFGQVSMTRAPGRFDNRRPTMTFAGAPPHAPAAADHHPAAVYVHAGARARDRHDAAATAGHHHPTPVHADRRAGHRHHHAGALHDRGAAAHRDHHPPRRLPTAAGCPPAEPVRRPARLAAGLGCSAAAAGRPFAAFGGQQLRFPEGRTEGNASAAGASARRSQLGTAQRRS